MIKDLTKLLTMILILSPCLAIFNENDNTDINLFGAAYAACLFIVYKLIKIKVIKIK